jgi:hypothetical protein
MGKVTPKPDPVLVKQRLTEVVRSKEGNQAKASRRREQRSQQGRTARERDLRYFFYIQRAGSKLIERMGETWTLIHAVTRST